MLNLNLASVQRAALRMMMPDRLLQFPLHPGKHRVITMSIFHKIRVYTTICNEIIFVFLL